MHAIEMCNQLLAFLACISKGLQMNGAGQGQSFLHLLLICACLSNRYHFYILTMQHDFLQLHRCTFLQGHIKIHDEQTLSGIFAHFDALNLTYDSEIRTSERKSLQNRTRSQFHVSTTLRYLEASKKQSREFHYDRKE